MEDHEWDARFKADNTPWERGGLNPAYLAWRQGALAEPCRILVPGAGRSPEPGDLARAVFNVTTLDIAPSSAAFQADALAGLGRAVEGDVFVWQPGVALDAVYDQTCLCALNPQRWGDYERQLYRWLRPGGALFLLMMQTGQWGGPPYDSPPDAVRAVFTTDRWDWPATLGEAVPHGPRAEIPVILHRRAD